MAGRGTPATSLLAQRGIQHRLHTYEHDPRTTSYGLEAAEQLHIPVERVVKTLVAVVDGTLTVGVIPVMAHLDLKALAAAQRGKRAVLAEIDDAQRATGYVAGGISPLGQKRRLPTVVDTSTTRFNTLYCSAGRRGLEIKISPTDLIQETNATIATIVTT